MRCIASAVVGLALLVPPTTYAQRLFDTFVPRPNIVDRPSGPQDYGRTMRRQSSSFFTMPKLALPKFNFQNAIHRFTFRFPFQQSYSYPRSTADLQTMNLPIRSRSPF